VRSLVTTEFVLTDGFAEWVGPVWPAPRGVSYSPGMSVAPPRLAKVHSTAQCERYVSFGWSIEHALHEPPGEEPYEYILEWKWPGLPLHPAHWGENWVGIATGGRQAQGLTAELQRELGPAHPLFELPLRPIARCLACDDVLFQVEPDGGYALVHLTWTQRVEHAPSPRTQFFKSEADIANAMSGEEH
jgi:hypothetical protein